MVSRRNGSKSHWMAFTIVIFLFVLPSILFAGGGQHYPNGVEAFLMGALPPPGFYVKEYNYWYTAADLKDNHGHTLSLGKSGVQLDRLSVYGVIPRMIWVSNFKILGGFYAQHFFIPILKGDMHLNALTPGGVIGQNDNRVDVGDLIYSPFIWGWHAKSGLLHIVTAVDIFIPTGPYNPNRLMNIGKNIWTFEPIVAATGFLPYHPNISGSIKLMYDLNTKNHRYVIGPLTAAKIGSSALTGFETDLSPGQEFHFDYSVEYALTKNFRLGATGYFYQQIMDDKTGLGRVKSDKGRVFAIGPGFWYNYNRWFFDLHCAFETQTKNRPQGVTSLLTIIYAL
jgi:hypothetical protein